MRCIFGVVISEKGFLEELLPTGAILSLPPFPVTFNVALEMLISPKKRN